MGAQVARPLLSRPRARSHARRQPADTLRAFAPDDRHVDHEVDGGVFAYDSEPEGLNVHGFRVTACCRGVSGVGSTVPPPFVRCQRRKRARSNQMSGLESG